MAWGFSLGPLGDSLGNLPPPVPKYSFPSVYESLHGNEILIASDFLLNLGAISSLILIRKSFGVFTVKRIGRIQPWIAPQTRPATRRFSACALFSGIQ